MTMRGRQHRRSRVEFVALVVVVVGLVLATQVWRIEPSRPGPSPVGATVEASSPRSDAAAPAESIVRAEPVRRALLEPGITGVLRASDGQALTSYRVALTAPRPLAAGDLLTAAAGPRRTDVATTDAAGRFAFRDLLAGEHTVGLPGLPQLDVRLSLPKGGSEFVELRLPPDLVAVEGRFVRAGEVQTEVHAVVACATGDNVLGSPDGRDGCIRMIVPAGAHVLHARSSYRGQSSPWLSLASHALSVPHGAARLSWQFEVGGCDLEVVVREQSGLQVRDLAVEIRGCTAREQSQLHVDCSTKAGNVARSQRLPPGRYQAVVTGADILPSSPHDFEIGFGVTRLQVPITVAAAATVRLRLLTDGRRELAVATASLPPLVAGDREIACSDLPGASRGTVSRRVPGYRSVPPGPVTLRFADEAVDDGLAFLPFDPPEQVEATARPGPDNEIVVTVVARAKVDLRGCERSGREQLAARVSVFAGAQRVASRATDLPNRWQGYLPPGDYRVVVDRGGQLREHGLVVVRDDIRLRLRP